MVQTRHEERPSTSPCLGKIYEEEGQMLTKEFVGRARISSASPQKQGRLPPCAVSYSLRPNYLSFKRKGYALFAYFFLKIVLCPHHIQSDLSDLKYSTSQWLTIAWNI